MTEVVGDLDWDGLARSRAMSAMGVVCVEDGSNKNPACGAHSDEDVVSPRRSPMTWAGYLA